MAIRLYKPKITKITYDHGTSDEQTVTTVSHDSLANRFFEWFCPKLAHVNTGIVEFWGMWKLENGRKYSGSGFYMSFPLARRLRWIWRGKEIYSFFWGGRVEGTEYCLYDDRREGFDRKLWSL